MGLPVTSLLPPSLPVSMPGRMGLDVSPEALDLGQRTWKSRWPKGTQESLAQGKGLLGQRHSMREAGLEEIFELWELPNSGLDWFFLNVCGGHDPSDLSKDAGPSRLKAGGSLKSLW